MQESTIFLFHRKKTKNNNKNVRETCYWKLIFVICSYITWARKHARHFGTWACKDARHVGKWPRKARKTLLTQANLDISQLKKFLMDNVDNAFFFLNASTSQLKRKKSHLPYYFSWNSFIFLSMKLNPREIFVEVFFSMVSILIRIILLFNTLNYK